MSCFLSSGVSGLVATATQPGQLFSYTCFGQLSQTQIQPHTPHFLGTAGCTGLTACLPSLQGAIHLGHLQQGPQPPTPSLPPQMGTREGTTRAKVGLARVRVVTARPKVVTTSPLEVTVSPLVGTASPQGLMALTLVTVSLSGVTVSLRVLICSPGMVECPTLKGRAPLSRASQEGLAMTLALEAWVRASSTLLLRSPPKRRLQLYMIHLPP